MKIVKRILSIAAILILSITIFCLIWLWHSGYTVPILTYHSVGYENDLVTVTPENFDRQLAYLKNNNYNVVPLDELVSGIKNNKNFNHKTIVITFDDGRKDNYQHAYPILKKYRFPVTIFLAVNLVNNRPDFLSWDDVRAMSKDNISFGAHTKNHIHLSSIESDEKLWDEIAGSKKVIEEHIKVPVEYFSYPYGAFNRKVRLIVEKAGYKGACTTNIGPGRFNEDVYALKRIRAKDSDPNKSFSFWAKLSGYYNLFRRPRLEVEP
jgi:peptidoglycan/xylan/chitin deacetylase (PgdA/CDA1 family)